MASPVTDPELLAALNGPEPKGKVTDPALLSVLEGDAHPLVAAHVDMSGPSVAEDVAKSGGIGLCKGGIGAVGAMGDLRHGASALLDRVGEKIGASQETIQALKDRAYQLAGLTSIGSVARDAPSSSDISHFVGDKGPSLNSLVTGQPERNI